MKDNISSEVRLFAASAYVGEAKRRGQRRFSIRVGDVHKQLGFQNRVPLVCNALKSREFLQDNDLRLVSTSGPRSGLSTSVTYTYEMQSGTPASGLVEQLGKLRGIAREVFESLGGGESFVREERNTFSVYRRDKHGLDVM